MRKILTLVSVAMSMSVSAQTALTATQATIREVQGELDAARLENAGARDAIKIEAGSANSQVSIKTSKKLDDGKGDSRAISLIASAPLAKSTTESTLANQNGLKSGTTLTLVLSSTKLTGIRVPGSETLALCEKGKRLRTAYLGIAGNSEDNFVCDTGTIKELAEKEKISVDEYRAFRSAFFGPEASVQSFGLTLSGGYLDSSYFDSTTLVQTKQRSSTGGIGLNFSYTPLEAAQLFAAALSLQSAYKDMKASTACLPTPSAGNTFLTCANGSIGAPTRQTTQVLDLEWRRKLSDKYAFALQLSRDIKEKVTSVQVPVYLIGNDKDGLNGGLSFGWTSDAKKITLGVFVGKAFSVQP
jgi:hypothetical protein